MSRKGLRPFPEKMKYLILLFLFAALPAHAESDKAGTLHVLNRLGYGPSPGDVARVEAMGVERYIEEQLHPESIPVPENLSSRLEALETLKMNPGRLFQLYGPGKNPEAVKAAHQKLMMQALQARLLRAMESPRQLQETMVEFWFNHFNVFSGKGLDYLWVGVYEEDAIRPNALGKFRDLLGATAKHPAMLFYLDNWLNTAPGSPGAKGRFEGLNENYAREIMELHTLGVEGGYTQQDVVSLARILTGWGLGKTENGFSFDPRRHDFQDKVFLGQTIRGEGKQEVEEALDILAKSPATARHIGYELAQYFVSDRPDPALVEKLADRFLETDGDIREVLRSLFQSRQFRDPKNFGNKFKSPYRYVVSAVRTSGIRVENYKPLIGMLWGLGEPLYGCQTPNGYQDTLSAWLNADAMMRRLSFATALGTGHLPIASPVTAPDPSLLAGEQMLSPATENAVRDAPEQLRAALILGSPEFMMH